VPLLQIATLSPQLLLSITCASVLGHTNSRPVSCAATTCLVSSSYSLVNRIPVPRLHTTRAQQTTTASSQTFLPRISTPARLQYLPRHSSAHPSTSSTPTALQPLVIPTSPHLRCRLCVEAQRPPSASWYCLVMVHVARLLY